eukprot:m.235306 g.235306  ORF g.235306 m.235306 type:complete len:426 (+) comp40124_c0_seq1:269-1546(+)
MLISLVFVTARLLLCFIPVTGILTDGTSPPSYSIVTYNTRFSLIGDENATQFERRRTAILETLNKSDADVLCLQETWLPEDIDAVVEGTKASFPYHHRATIGQVPANHTPCDASTFTVYLTCVATKCPIADPIQQLVCAFQQCKEELVSIGQECITCNILNVHLGTGAIQLCLSPGHYPNTHGLLMLSKKTLSEKTEFTYSKDEIVLLTRGYISALVQEIGHVFCTHLTTGISGTDHYFGAPPFSNYSEEQTNQLKQLLSAANSVQDTFSSSIVTGDMNHSPAIGDRIQGELVEVYQMVQKDGYVDTYVANQPEAKCTFCRENPLAVSSIEAADRVLGIINGTREGTIVDHIYVPEKDASRVVRAQRIWDTPVSFNGHLLYLSDHYGVLVEYRPPVTDLLSGWKDAFDQWQKEFDLWKSDSCSSD